MTQANLPDDRGIARRIKRRVSPELFRKLTVAYNALLKLIPYRVKYSVAGLLRRDKAPYCLIAPDDVVVQIGAPRDLLNSGRSRAIHFARLVPHGTVVIIEPDPDNVAALRQFVCRNRLDSQVVVVELGAWSKKTTVQFLSSATHPAASAVEEVNFNTDEERLTKKYRRMSIPVDTVDSILQQGNFKTPKLVSITTNGSDFEILDGMRATIEAGCLYISLAAITQESQEYMQRIKYERIAYDDRGFTYRKRPE